MIQSVYYCLACAAAILFIIFLLREMLGRKAGVHTSAPFGAPTNDHCWWCHRDLGADRKLANLPTGQKAFVCSSCASALPGMKRYIAGGSDA